MIILYALAYTVSQPEDKEKIAQLLKKESLWKHVSPEEKTFLDEQVTDEQKLIGFSWGGEAAYILAWALNLIGESPTPTQPVSERQLDLFMIMVPPLGVSLTNFLSSLSYREVSEIYNENLFHAMATSYFRDLLFNGNTDNSDIDRRISFMRHKTLNWVRLFMGIKEWDDADTST